MTFFFLQTTILTLIGPLFTILRRAPEAKSAQGKRTPKGPPYHFLLFQGKYKTGRAQRVPPLSFLIFCNGMFVNKSRRPPPFYIFRHYATSFERNFFFKNFNFFPKMFYAFWALDMAPTLDVLVLFTISKPHLLHFARLVQPETFFIEIRPGLACFKTRQ